MATDPAELERMAKVLFPEEYEDLGISDHPDTALAELRQRVVWLQQQTEKAKQPITGQKPQVRVKPPVLQNLYRFNSGADTRFRQVKEGFDIRIDDDKQTVYFEGTLEDAEAMRDWLNDLLEAPHA